MRRIFANKHRLNEKLMKSFHWRVPPRQWKSSQFSHIIRWNNGCRIKYFTTILHTSHVYVLENRMEWIHNAAAWSKMCATVLFSIKSHPCFYSSFTAFSLWIYTFWWWSKEIPKLQTHYIFWIINILKKVKLIFHACSRPVSLRALNNRSWPTEGHLKQKPNFLLGESAAILIKMKGLKQDVR